MIKNSEKLKDNVFNVVGRDYLPIIGFETYGIYCYLFRRQMNFNNEIDVDSLSKCFRIDNQKLLKSLSILETSSLITLKKQNNKYKFEISLCSGLATPNQLFVLDQLFENKLIDENEKKLIYEIISIQKSDKLKMPSKDEDSNTKNKIDAVKDVKLKAEIHPDSGPGLVKLYYKLLRETIGGNYFSPNPVAEAHLVLSSMRKNNDSPEDVRKMFKYIIDENKRKNTLDQIFTLGLYSYFRNSAYYNCILKNEPQKEIQTEEQEERDKIEYIKNVYNYNIQMGKEHNDIINILVKQRFSKSILDKVFKGQENK